MKMPATDPMKLNRAHQLRSQLEAMDKREQFQPFKELYSHKTAIVNWMLDDAATHYTKFLEDLTALYLTELANNYLNDKREDVSDVIRGRLFELKEILGIPEQLKAIDKIKAELAQLEAEGYTKSNMPKQVKPENQPAGVN